MEKYTYFLKTSQILDELLLDAGAMLNCNAS